MKLQLEVEIGYYWDYLSIIGVKFDKTQKPEAYAQYLRCKDNLVNQIGLEKFDEIFASDEYIALYDVNSYLFGLVDEIKKDKSIGQELDNQVYQRWLRKKALQEKFYPESEYSEIKVGYKEVK